MLHAGTGYLSARPVETHLTARNRKKSSLFLFGCHAVKGEPWIIYAEQQQIGFFAVWVVWLRWGLLKRPLPLGYNWKQTHSPCIIWSLRGAIDEMETKTKQMSAPPGLFKLGRLFSGTAAQLAQFLRSTTVPSISLKTCPPPPFSLTKTQKQKANINVNTWQQQARKATQISSKCFVCSGK